MEPTMRLDRASSTLITTAGAPRAGGLGVTIITTGTSMLTGCRERTGAA